MKAAWICGALAFYGAAAWGQTFTGAVQGTVRDTTGGAVTAAVLKITNLETGLDRTTATSSDGAYLFTSLAPGEYRVDVRQPGFRPESVRLTLQVNQKAQVDLTLGVGEVTESVNVVASAALVNTSDASVGQVVNERKVKDLPLNGRDFVQLALLSSGVEKRQTTRGLLAVNGTRGNSLGFLFDGVDGNDANAIFLSLSPSIEAIQEFNIQTSNYSAEFGRNAGGQINLVSKGGGNQIHGTLFHFLRNSALDAKDFFAPATQPIPPYKRNQFGVVFSGPIRKNGTFFLLNYEGNRIRQSPTALAVVPTALEKQGDFSQSFNALTGALIVVRDPANNQPFAGNRIPQNRVDPVGLKVAALYPNPNRPGAQNFVSSLSQPFDSNVGTARIDHKLSDRDTIFGRYFISNSLEFSPLGRLNGAGGTTVPGFGMTIPGRGQNLALNWTRVWSPSLVTEIRLGYHRYNTGRFQENSSDKTKELGIAGASTAPFDYGFPLFTITGFPNVGDRGDLPQFRPQNTYHYFGNVSKTIGRHTLKTGFETRFEQENLTISSGVRGSFTFNPTFTGYALGDVLVGQPTTATITTNGIVCGMRDHIVGAFFQDDFHVTSKLTLNLGLRYEYFSPVIDKYDNRAVFDFRNLAITRVGTGDIPRGGYFPDRNNFGPRFGFAYAPAGNARMVVRGGYGVFFDKENFNSHLGLFTQPTFRLTLQFQQPGSIGSAFSATAAGLPPPNANAVDFEFADAYYQHWNLVVEKSAGASTVLSAAYVASKGTKLPGGRDMNQPAPRPGNIQANRPLSGYGVISYRYGGHSSIYHSLQLNAEKRSAQGLTFLVNYTLSRAIDDGPLYGAALQDAENLRADRGLSDIHSPHRFNGSVLYELPFGKGKRFLGGASRATDLLAGGWQVNGIVALLAGVPFTPVTGRDIANIGRTGQRPDRTGRAELSDPDPAMWFDSRAFIAPALYRFGNSGRNILLGPGVTNFDLSLFKHFTVRESHVVQFRAEFFNAFNVPSFGQPNANIDAPAAVGRVSTTQGTNRQIQFALKYSF